MEQNTTQPLDYADRQPMAVEANTVRLREALDRLEMMMGRRPCVEERGMDDFVEHTCEESRTVEVSCPAEPGAAEPPAPQDDVLSAPLHELQRALQAAETRAEDAERLVARLREQVRALEEQLRADRAGQGQIESDRRNEVEDLRAEIKRLAKERDRLLTRLERQKQRIERAGLEIQWGEEFVSPIGRRGRSQRNA